jgi:hypothetical protein
MGQVTIPAPAGLKYNRQVFLSSGTFTLPTTAFNKFDCVLVGGGGGGARTTTSQRGNGGGGVFAYFSDVYCTNGTTLTITVGAGGAGSTSLGYSGALGSASTISNILGNGVSTSLTSGQGSIGFAKGTATNQYAGPIANISSNVVSNSSFYNQMNSGNQRAGYGPGSFAAGSAPVSNGNAGAQIGSGYLRMNTFTSPYFGYRATFEKGSAIYPLLGDMLHATAGATGQTVTGAGAISNPDTFFAGAGGGSVGATPTTGSGGGGGAGGYSNSATLSGNGGAGSANSGGGGGSCGFNTSDQTKTGNGGNGGSGFVIIGYWG